MGTARAYMGNSLPAPLTRNGSRPKGFWGQAAGYTRTRPREQRIWQPARITHLAHRPRTTGSHPRPLDTPDFAPGLLRNNPKPLSSPSDRIHQPHNTTCSSNTYTLQYLQQGALTLPRHWSLTSKKKPGRWRRPSRRAIPSKSPPQ